MPSVKGPHQSRTHRAPRLLRLALEQHGTQRDEVAAARHAQRLGLGGVDAQGRLHGDHQLEPRDVVEAEVVGEADVVVQVVDVEVELLRHRAQHTGANRLGAHAPSLTGPGVNGNGREPPGYHRVPRP
jgi:hypothetical protein